VIIPAHNEQKSIARLLTALLDNRGEFEIVVVCNGCKDETADVARGFGSAVGVVETPVASKPAALRLGDSIASHFPRVYVDADVQIGAADVRALAEALSATGALASGPLRSVDMTGTSRVVRWYYAVWQELPQVRNGLFGRGVIAMSRAGHERVRALPNVMSDDLAMSEAFADAERLVVDSAVVGIKPPRTLGDLLRRRIRIVTGTVQVDSAALRSKQSMTSMSTLVGMARREPCLGMRIPVFLAIAVAAKIGARSRVRAGDYTTWLRDESSRAS
jgi:glycosyltransferase involved in cell wall biosynthesis